MAKKIIDGIQYAIGELIFRKDKENDKVLMMRREGKYDKGWEPIKGAVNVGETDEQALMREISEESGIKVRIIEKLPIHYCNEVPDQGRIVKIDASIYVCEYLSGKVRMGEAEHRGYKWMDIEEAVNAIWIKGGGRFINEAYYIFNAHK